MLPRNPRWIFSLGMAQFISRASTAPCVYFQRRVRGHCLKVFVSGFYPEKSMCLSAGGERIDKTMTRPALVIAKSAMHKISIPMIKSNLCFPENSLWIPLNRHGNVQLYIDDY